MRKWNLSQAFASVSKDAVIEPGLLQRLHWQPNTTNTTRSHPVVSGNPCLMIYSHRGEVSAPFLCVESMDKERISK